MHRLHAKGLIENPHSRAKSVRFTDEGMQVAERLLEQLFAQRPPGPGAVRQADDA